MMVKWVAPVQIDGKVKSAGWPVDSCVIRERLMFGGVLGAWVRIGGARVQGWSGGVEEAWKLGS